MQQITLFLCMSRDSCRVKFWQVPTNKSWVPLKCLLYYFFCKKWRVQIKSEEWQSPGLTQKSCNYILYMYMYHIKIGSNVIRNYTCTFFFKYAIIRFVVLDFSVFLKSEIILYFGIFTIHTKMLSQSYIYIFAYIF